MNFPYQAFQVIIAYLTWLGAGGSGTAPSTIPELVRAATAIVNWAVDLIYGTVGITTVQSTMPVSRADQIKALNDLCVQARGGASAQSLGVPSWLLDLMLDLLIEWAKGRLKP